MNQKIEKLKEIFTPLSEEERENLIWKLRKVFCFDCGRLYTLLDRKCYCNCDE